jgi:hypothetical protein
LTQRRYTKNAAPTMSTIQENAVSAGPSPEQPPNSLIYLDEEATLVEDADEEVTFAWPLSGNQSNLCAQIFSLYANLATSQRQDAAMKPGLGFVSSNDANYHVEFALQPVKHQLAMEPFRSESDKATGHPSRRSKAKKVVGRRQDTAEKIIAVDIAQDLASLRNRKGDTGMVFLNFGSYHMLNISLQGV